MRQIECTTAWCLLTEHPPNFIHFAEPLLATHYPALALLTTLFTLAVVGYALLRPKLPSGPLGSARWIAIVAVVGGLATFSSISVVANLPITGRTQWSASDLLGAIYRGELSLAYGSFAILASYALMLVAFCVLLLRRSRKPLLIASICGLFTATTAFRMSHALLFPWLVTAPDGVLRAVWVRYTPAMYALPIVMTLILLLAVVEIPERGVSKETSKPLLTASDADPRNL